jgi:hypothetical protein
MLPLSLMAVVSLVLIPEKFGPLLLVSTVHHHLACQTIPSQAAFLINGDTGSGCVMADQIEIKRADDRLLLCLRRKTKYQVG